MIKKITPFFILLLMLVGACEKEEGLSNTDLPQLALEIFNTKYDGATGIVWVKDFNQYHVSFTFDGKQSVGKFTSAGDWLITQTVITYEDIPEEVIASLRNSEFKFWVIVRDEITLEDTPKFGPLYRLVMNDNAEIKPLYFEEDGTFVNKGL